MTSLSRLGPQSGFNFAPIKTTAVTPPAQRPGWPVRGRPRPATTPSPTPTTTRPWQDILGEARGEIKPPPGLNPAPAPTLNQSTAAPTTTSWIEKARERARAGPDMSPWTEFDTEKRQKAAFPEQYARWIQSLGGRNPHVMPGSGFGQFQFGELLKGGASQDAIGRRMQDTWKAIQNPTEVAPTPTPFPARPTGQKRPLQNILSEARREVPSRNSFSDTDRKSLITELGLDPAQHPTETQAGSDYLRKAAKEKAEYVKNMTGEDRAYEDWSNSVDDAGAEAWTGYKQKSQLFDFAPKTASRPIAGRATSGVQRPWQNIFSQARGEAPTSRIATPRPAAQPTERRSMQTWRGF